MISITKNLTRSPKALPPSNQLGFGQHFTDHMFLARYVEGRGWGDASVVPYGPLSVDPGASVFHYGQALFEGMKAFRQRDGRVVFFRPEFNYHRLVEGAERLCLEPPTMEVFMEGLHQLVAVDERWIPHEPNTSLYIRPTLIGTEPFLGVRPSRETLFFILLSPVGSYYAEGSKPVKIWTEESYLRAAPGGLGAVKAGANYASSLKAALAAKKKGYAQVLWLDVEHQGIEEVGTMNVFFVFDGEIVTPALNGSILPGGTREAVLQILRSRGLPAVERRITITEVMDRLKKGELKEVFGTGTAAVISPVGVLNYRGQDYVINNNENGPLSTQLFDEITSIQDGQRPDSMNWLVALKK